MALRAPVGRRVGMTHFRAPAPAHSRAQATAWVRGNSGPPVRSLCGGAGAVLTCRHQKLVSSGRISDTPSLTPQDLEGEAKAEGNTVGRSAAVPLIARGGGGRHNSPPTGQSFGSEMLLVGLEGGGGVQVPSQENLEILLI